MIYPLVRELAAESIPVAVTCRVLGFSKQAFDKWQACPVSQRDWDDAHLINAAYDIHHDDPAFGYRFIADELREQGFAAGENRVARLCSQQRIWSIFSKKRGLDRKAGPPVHDDLVDRQFTAAAPNLLWLTDITEHRTAEGSFTSARSRTSTRDPAQQRPGRLDGPSRRLRRQRRHGVLLRPAAEERSGPAALGHSRRTPVGDPHLNREDLSPPPTATSPRPPDTVEYETLTHAAAAA